MVNDEHAGSSDIKESRKDEEKSVYLLIYFLLVGVEEGGSLRWKPVGNECVGVQPRKASNGSCCHKILGVGGRHTREPCASPRPCRVLHIALCFCCYQALLVCVFSPCLSNKCKAGQVIASKSSEGP